ncbi:hypothetical protein ARAM_004448 [Aspergillus rambellii]|uniref:Aminotransferase class V domain-containing protein n=1 Tax=Aspergillus rambellii TaxID=308745 RepID=A0A0F8URJ0_9EURO|nr:hypothetical protein ARAM_004448 [Aspergillus rambellii]
MAEVSHQDGYDVDQIRETEYPMLKGSTSSMLSTARVQEARKHVLEFFKASPDHFDIVFVLNATSAMKLVVEGFISHETGSTTSPSLWYGYHVDSHTSAIGIRQLASAGHHCFASDNAVDRWLETGSLVAGGQNGGSSSPAASRVSQIGLFAYPGQSNMTGRRLPLNWPGRLRRSTLAAHQQVYSLLDAAALASTAPVDLSDPSEAADFTTVSFYKIFGFPDLGALIVRKDAAHLLLRRPYFGGGTVEMVLCNGESWHSAKKGAIHEALEDGTVPFHNIIALDCALSTHQRLYGSMDQVSRHTSKLVSHLYHKLSSLRHQNGSNVCQIYKDPSAIYGDRKTQGPVVAFNLTSADGSWVKLSDLEAAANEHHIHLRTGDVCNPGGIARHLNLAPWELFRNFRAGVRCGCKNVMIGQKLRDCADLTHNGLRWDGQWCLVGLETGAILTPLEVPRLLLVYPEIDSCRRTLRIRVHRSLRTSPMVNLDITVPVDHEMSEDAGNYAHAADDTHAFWDEDRGKSVQLHLYREPKVQVFLTAALGVRCTLARVLHQECRDRMAESTPPANLEALTVFNGVDSLNSPQLLNNLPGSVDIQRPRQVSIAETLGANLVLSPVSEQRKAGESDNHCFAYIGTRHSAKSPVVSDGVQEYHLVQIKESKLSTQGTTPEEFKANCAVKKLVWGTGNSTDKTALYQVHAGQIVSS